MSTIITDTHSHIYADQFKEDQKEVIKRAIDTGVSRMFMPNIDSSSIDAMLNVHRQFPDHCFPMMGLHPCSVNKNWKVELETVYNWLFEQDEQKFVAVGEIGLDYHWDTTFKEEQKKAFETQIEWAKKLNLPIVIHVRDSFDDAIEIVEKMNDDTLKGIFHCFSGTKSEAERVIALGDFYIGLGGVLTFKNSNLRNEIKEIPLNSIVLETDAPYLAPVPHRGKRNECSYTKLVAEHLAEVKSESLETIAAITTQNSKQLFNC